MKMRGFWLAPVAFTAALAAQTQPGEAPADAIYYNGTFITMSEERPTAHAVAIRGDRFIAVGTRAEVIRFDGPSTRHFNLAGRTVVPGLIDPRNAINPFHPFFSMWMAITRKTVDGTVLSPDETITRAQALRMWTVNGAWTTSEEKLKGSIEPGKLADMVVITKDYLICPVDEIKDIEPILTMVGGRVVYERPGSPVRVNTVIRSQ